MSVAFLGWSLLAVSLVSVVIYMSALGQLLIGARQPGLIRTGVCRLVAALLYVGVGLTTVVTNEKGPIIGLAIFTIVQLIWQANSIADVRLTRRTRRNRVSEGDLPGVTDPVPNYATPLPAVVVSAEIDRLSGLVNTLTRRFDEEQEIVHKDRARGKYGYAALAFVFVLAICGLIFGLITFNRADSVGETATRNSALIKDLKNTQARLESSVKASCTLYRVIFGTYNSRSKASFPQGPEAYDLEFQNMFKEAEKIQCGLSRPIGLPG